MAVYHMAVSVGSHGGGASAGSKDNYLEREGKYKEEESQEREVEHVEHECANGTLYREVQFALPRELSADQRRELAVGFAERLTAKENLPYTLAVHRGGGDNPHAHLMISERRNDGISRSAETWFKRANSKNPPSRRRTKDPIPPGKEVAGGTLGFLFRSGGGTAAPGSLSGAREAAGSEDPRGERQGSVKFITLPGQAPFSSCSTCFAAARRQRAIRLACEIVGKAYLASFPFPIRSHRRPRRSSSRRIETGQLFPGLFQAFVPIVTAVVSIKVWGII